MTLDSFLLVYGKRIMVILFFLTVTSGYSQNVEIPTCKVAQIFSSLQALVYLVSTLYILPASFCRLIFSQIFVRPLLNTIVNYDTKARRPL
jgi:hypothetical protein